MTDSTKKRRRKIVTRSLKQMIATSPKAKESASKKRDDKYAAQIAESDIIKEAREEAAEKKEAAEKHAKTIAKSKKTRDETAKSPPSAAKAGRSSSTTAPKTTSLKDSLAIAKKGLISHKSLGSLNKVLRNSGAKPVLQVTNAESKKLIVASHAKKIINSNGYMPTNKKTMGMQNVVIPINLSVHINVSTLSSTKKTKLAKDFIWFHRIATCKNQYTAFLLNNANEYAEYTINGLKKIEEDSGIDLGIETTHDDKGVTILTNINIDKHQLGIMIIPAFGLDRQDTTPISRLTIPIKIPKEKIRTLKSYNNLYQMTLPKVENTEPIIDNFLELVESKLNTRSNIITKPYKSTLGLGEN